MNVHDSERLAGLLEEAGYVPVALVPEKAARATDAGDEGADVVVVNTCSVRENAATRLFGNLGQLAAVKRERPGMQIAVGGCLAQQMRGGIVERAPWVDAVLGTHNLDVLPALLRRARHNAEAAVEIEESLKVFPSTLPTHRERAYAAWVSISVGCNNTCTFCIVPFTRGRERSRDPYSILNEIADLQARGFKEVTLLGQNVDSYLWYGGGLKKDFSKASEMQQATAINFAKLLDMVATAQPEMRIRFSTSNPQDMTLDVIDTMAKHPNICKYIHLPVQSGSNRILKAMNRLHTREEYFTLIDSIRERIPECAISQDMIAGFPTETEEDHRDTLSLMEYVKYDFGFMFAYSERPGTLAARKIEDDVPEEVKKRRLAEIIDLQQKHSLYRTQAQIGKTVEVLIEGNSKKSDKEWMGRNSQNTVVVFPKEDYKIGDFVMVKITDCTSTTLIGKAVKISNERQ